MQYAYKGLIKLIPSYTIIHGWVINEFRKQKQQLQNNLQKAQPNIYLSFNL